MLIKKGKNAWNTIYEYHLVGVAVTTRVRFINYPRADGWTLSSKVAHVDSSTR